MSRYLAFVFLALSASSVLAAPAEIPQLPNAATIAGPLLGARAELPSLPSIPDTTTITQPLVGPRAEIPQLPALSDATTVVEPVLGARSNGKVYSPNTLRKRDWQYPESTKDCRSSEVPKDSASLSYTHEGQEYSEECLTHLALSVPPEYRESCRTTGVDARGYDEECLFKKAFDEDWKFDMEKAKKDELAWRSANTPASSSDAWRTLFPNTISDCLVTVTIGKRATDGWSPYTVLPTGETLENDCLVRLILGTEIVLDLGICASVEVPELSADLLSLDLTALITLFGRSTTELATRQESATVAVAVSVLAALRSGCLLGVVARIIATLGIDVRIAGDPLNTVVALVTGLLAILLG